MQRLMQIGKIVAKNSNQVKESRIGIGFEKLDRNVFDPEKAYDKVAATGVKWVRIQSGWARTEMKKGEYDFSWLDEIVDNLVRRGLRPWICLCYGNGIYDSNAAKVFGAVGVPPIFNEEQKNAWKNYVTALVRRYKDRVTHYEVWNEPDGIWCWKHGVNAAELGAFTAATARYVHAEFPEAEVIGLVICCHKLDFINEALSTDQLGQEIDAISFHEYTTDERSVPSKVAALHGVANLYKEGIKIIQGESGSQSRAGGNGALKDRLWSEKAQAKQLARHTLIDLSTDVEFTSYFSCMDMIEALNGQADEKGSYQDYGYFGVLGAEFDENGFAIGSYKEKPSYYVLQNIASVFAERFEVIKYAPVRFTKNPFNGYGEADEEERNVISFTAARKAGSQVFVYWKPENILTTDYQGTISVQFVTKRREFVLLDFMTGTVYKIPDGMVKKIGTDVYEFINLPIKDTPLALCFGNFCEWRKDV